MHGNVGPNRKTNECDVLIAIGMRFDDRVTGDLKTYAKQAKIVPSSGDGTWPAITTIGVLSISASAIPVMVLVAPGPEVTTVTPTFPETRAYPCAACVAPCSWRTRICFN